MPVPTVEQLEQREAAQKRKLVGDKAADPRRRRSLRKRLRRLQRRRRLQVAKQKRAAPKAAEAPSS